MQKIITDPIALKFLSLEIICDTKYIWEKSWVSFIGGDSFDSNSGTVNLLIRVFTHSKRLNNQRAISGHEKLWLCPVFVFVSESNIGAIECCYRFRFCPVFVLYLYLYLCFHFYLYQKAKLGQEKVMTGLDYVLGSNKRFSTKEGVG